MSRSTSMEESPKHTCLKLEIPTHTRDSEPIFVKGTWYPSRFVLAITDGLDSWTCNASEDEVKDRASQWDQPVSEYIDLAEKYLGFQQPGSVYGFSDAGNGHKRLTWTFEKEGTKLEWRWKCQPSATAKKTTASVLDFLMDSNIQLSEEVIRKTDAFEKLKAEAEKCIAQSERLASEKTSFEVEVYPKFVGLLNSKKEKLRDLKERLSKQKGAVASALPEDDDGDESTDKTESFDEESNGEEGSNDNAQTGTTKEVSSASRARGQKRKY